MNLNAWLARLEKLHPTEIELGLGRVAQVAKALNLNDLAPLVITVAGTNGKGTTLALLTKALHLSGYRVGVYTSPHLQKYNERVGVDGQQVSDDKLCEAFARVEKARAEVSLTYFEFGTLAALDIFSRARLDAVLLEVGLGGRLDAVNLVDADLAVITSIDLDHQEWLGDTREMIGYEKAGIMRAGAPAVCGDLNPPLSLINHAQALNASLDCAGESFGYQEESEQDGATWKWWGTSAQGRVEYSGLPKPKIPLQNASTALQCLHRLPCSVTEEAIREALLQVAVKGRYQRLRQPFPMVLDVAHNPQAARYLAAKIAQESGKIIAIFGAMADKDIAGIVAPLLDKVTYWHCCNLPLPRAAKAERLAELLLAQDASASVSVHAGVAEAMDSVPKQMGSGDLVLVFGSFYTVGEALNYLEMRSAHNG